MKSIYLIKVWKESKPLFICIIAFIILQFFFIAKRVQNFPFFIFDMYSRPIEKPATFSLYRIEQFQDAINYTSFTNTKENIVLNTIKTYQLSKQSYPKAPNEAVIEHRFKNNVSCKNYQFIKDGLMNDIASIYSYQDWLSYYCSCYEIDIKEHMYDYDTKKWIYTRNIPTK